VVKLYKTKCHSPVGRLILVASDTHLRAVLWDLDRPRNRFLVDPVVEGENDVLRASITQLEEYFARQRREFSIPLEMLGTDFQCQVWEELRKIPYGQTISYAQLAQRVQSPAGFRAVGAANGRNPISIIVPCHRVIGSSGKLTGFGGGLGAKQGLLELEGNLLF
jgi:methylated-DNA-[protein]-cysteine S-methyltransferase